jgi:Transglutaminase-like superfamily
MCEDFLRKLALALDVILSLLRLPVLLRIHTMPVLLARLARCKDYGTTTQLKFNDAVRIVTRACNLRMFRSRAFPKLCLRQSLTLYRILSRMGYPVQIHFGVMKDETGFRGHSWLTLEGEAVADTAPSEIFKTVYSYCSARLRAHCSNRNDKAIQTSII